MRGDPEHDSAGNALARRIKAQPVHGSALGLDLCYTIQSMANLTLPFAKLALVFDGSDGVMNLRRSNYDFFRDNDTGLECLTIVPYTGVSLLGSLVQTDRNMTYDMNNSQLVFDGNVGAAHAGAARPVHALESLVMALPFALWMLVLF